MKFLIDKKNKVDILFIAEGTYPYVRGGVSSWIHQLINGLKHYRFGVVFMGSRSDDYGEVVYVFPENLDLLVVSYLFDDPSRPKIKAIEGDKKSIDNVEYVHEWFKNHEDTLPPELQKLNFYTDKVSESFFLYAHRSWEYIEKKYNERASDIPFIDYFWTVRNIHSPIWVIARIAKLLEGRCRSVHSPSTGYAGFAAALLAFNDKIYYILTEHGIYTKERKIDLLTNDFLSYHKFDIFKKLDENDTIKEMWVRFFEGIGRFSYKRADVILSLFNGAKMVQIAYGANVSKCRIVPNGVDVKKLGGVIEKRPPIVPNIITLIGRVVSIKDIKTFIRAIRIVQRDIPDIQGWIVGPTDEEEQYAQECMDMVETFSLSDNIKFLGFQNILDVLPKSGLLTLTSISEGMPLVVLEGFAAGLPAVTTDVGSCRELIYGGLGEEDLALGAAGEVVSIADPGALAKAYTRLLQDSNHWHACQQTALARVNQYYTQELFFQTYDEIYQKAMQPWQE
jgi:glycosyltransferase involved in cell wall biosynthesis